MEPLQESVINDIEERMYLTHATTGVRFANYVIDLIVFYLVYLGAMMAFGIILASSGYDAYQISDFVHSPIFKLYNFIIVYTVYLLVYFLFEGATKGRTLGKIITGTRAIREDGEKISWKDAFLRSASRIVPFEVFSGLGGFPWHDTWTKTMVVKNRG